MSKPEQKPVRKYNKYSDELKAQALATLEINGGNVKGTARQLGIPWETLRSWQGQYDKINRGEIVATRAISADVLKLKEEGIADFIDRAETVRDAALDKLKVLIPQATVAQIAALTNLTISLSERIDRAHGVANKHDVVEHKHTIAPSEEWAKALTEYASKARDDAIERSREIIDLDAIEQPDVDS